MSHGEVADLLSGDGFDRATVYRNLLALTEAGILRRTDLGDHVWRFELMGSGPGDSKEHGHPHFVCTECSTVTCLTKMKVRFDGPQAALAKRGVELQLRGECDTCSVPRKRRARA